LRYVHFEQQSDVHPALEAHLLKYVEEGNASAAAVHTAGLEKLAELPPFRVIAARSFGEKCAERSQGVAMYRMSPVYEDGARKARYLNGWCPISSKSDLGTYGVSGGGVVQSVHFVTAVLA
jgi:hypothetical protein